MNELIGIAAIAIVAWFAGGTIYNVRKASAFMRWMQAGLPGLGGRATVRWLGSTAVQLGIAEAKAPLASAALVVFLEPRDLPWWPLSRWRGRRDTLIVRGAFARPPAVEFEAIDAASWSGRDALARIPREWAVASAAPGRLAIHHADAASLQRAEAMLAVARDARFGVRRLSVRRAEPHFQVHVALPGPGHDAREFFERLRTLAELALQEHGRPA